MTKIVIIDDEFIARSLLTNMLKEYFPEDYTIVGSCSSVKDGVKAIQDFDADLVFLDIQMPEEFGFELFKYFSKINFEVIFVTAYSQYAIQAIQCSALDYLLKPIDTDLFRKAIHKFLENRPKKIPQEEQMKVLLEHLENERNTNNHRRMAFPTCNGVECVHTKNIIYCESDGNYTTIQMTNENNILVSKPLKTVEELLPEALFKRVHKSFLIKMDAVKRYNKMDKLVELTDNFTIPVAHRKEAEFLKELFGKD
ncbi:two component transcriptional regulator, LytTR family [Arenibacter nanhaiticus]|uniref:Two component transcriptional regulator, LytTR family n=1 Tax=Arenibacter nanhaiticus TaxID=558155 RepID=A0A1M6LFD8_9FLAO|nr:LytTR family DNA-binding domain-containing protein [Arenibacter nanhaiticus]SHJ69909.1 two component transcriptional regulator, LytTR family [Arenibacter nanhaiticus]